ncbi:MULTISPECIES: hypothetical protein [Paraburkholderia]|jgi:hypothetical protein|uniref:hypothetical protein n=1 Tax=Paraburkholderia TaxID=1822464 RepID=UPI0009E8A38A|nr:MULTISPECIES: hypothetical protein [Paraburkholderia]AUT54786.1 hypothetical protein C2L66_23480 [Paraburkholderia caribensis]CAG9192854.1 hypothetical protein BCAR13_1060139 [Paraburkholderia caribensis]
MSLYGELERELAHIRTAIALLEQTRGYFSSQTPVGDPAYWAERLRTAVSGYVSDRAIEKQAEELLARLNTLKNMRPKGRCCGRGNPNA